MSQLFIQNTEPRLHTLCVIMRQPEEERAKGKGDKRENIQLQPGINPVEKALWEEAKKVKTVRCLLDEGRLVERGPTADGTLKDIQEAQAIKLIKETFAIKLLQGWLLEEKRPNVKKAVQQQLDTIERESRPEKKEGEA